MGANLEESLAEMKLFEVRSEDRTERAKYGMHAYLVNEWTSSCDVEPTVPRKQIKAPLATAW